MEISGQRTRNINAAKGALEAAFETIKDAVDLEEVAQDPTAPSVFTTEDMQVIEGGAKAAHEKSKKLKAIGESIRPFFPQEHKN